MNDKNVFVSAEQVQIGDNVWEHNVVREIEMVVKHESDVNYMLFNGSGQYGRPWFADKATKVMVTNRA